MNASQGRYKQSIPYVVFGTASVLASAASTLLPESAREALPQTVADAEAFGRGETFLAWRLAPWRERTEEAGVETARGRKDCQPCMKLFN